MNIKGAIKKGLPYEEAKKQGIHIRKQYYLTLKKIYNGQELTENQKKTYEQMKKSKKWAGDVKWAGAKSKEGTKGKISIKGAIKKGMSYKEMKEYKIKTKIGKNYYLTLKKLYGGQELTENQKKTYEQMKKSKKWQDIVKWAEAEAEKKKKEKKQKYTRAEGTVIISGGYVAKDKRKRRSTRVYYEYVINTVAYGKNGDDAELTAEQTIAHNIRQAISEFLRGSELEKGTVAHIRVELQDDWDWEEVDNIGENKATILDGSFIIEKHTGREYDYTEKIKELLMNNLINDGWVVK